MTPANSSRDEPRRGDATSDSEDESEDDAAALRALIERAHAAGPLAPGQEATLLARAALGDRASQDRLVEVHLDQVIRLAAGRTEHGLTVPDLVQEGSIGLLQAVRSFADSGETDFGRYAEARISAQMDAAISDESAAVREGELLVAAATDYERTELLMSRALHRAPTAAELAEKLEWTVERTMYVAQVVADARRRYDEEMLAFIDPEALDFDDDDSGRPELDG
jgi:RNA polymerase sigma factor (sigma-70 family)